MKYFRLFTLAVLCACSGCGTIATGMMDGRVCPYGGVQYDFWVMTNLDAVVGSYGLIIPLAVIDMPASFIFDTLMLEKTKGMTCPEWR